MAREKQPRRRGHVDTRDAGDDVKSCVQCGEQLPLTADYYHRDANRPDGFTATCIICRNKRIQEKENKLITSKVEKLDEASLTMLDTLLSGRGSDVPHIVELYQRIIEIFDGVGGFAQHYMVNYLSAKPGSMIRQRMLDQVFKIAIKVSEEGMAQAPIDLMLDEDVQHELARREQLRIRHEDRKDEGAA